MALKSSGFFRSLLTLAFVVMLKPACAQSTVVFDSVFTKLFDRELYPVTARVIDKTNKPIIIISGVNCSGCVKYFTTNQKEYVLLFVLQNESLLEAERIKERYKLSGKAVYFTTVEYSANRAQISQSPSPCLMINSSSGLRFYDYSQLSHLTDEFSVSQPELKKRIRKYK